LKSDEYHLVDLSAEHVEVFSDLLTDPDVIYGLYPELRGRHYREPLADWLPHDNSRSNFSVAIVSRENVVLGGLQVVDNWLAYFVGKQFWGRGAGYAAVQQAITRVSLSASSEELKAVVERDNPRSHRILENCGFSFSGFAATPNDSIRLFNYRLRIEHADSTLRCLSPQRL
jgi:RimJ/RimL family protein N-acetyltransferase